MFGISGVEFIIIVVIAFVVIGPERMPEYAQQAKEFIKQMRRMAFDAKDDLKETLGPGLEDINWRQYDPRQYDPRTIVREALAEDDEEREKERLESQASSRELTPAASAAPAVERLSVGSLAPFDIEAT